MILHKSNNLLHKNVWFNINQIVYYVKYMILHKSNNLLHKMYDLT